MLGGSGEERCGICGMRGGLPRGHDEGFTMEGCPMQNLGSQDVVGHSVGCATVTSSV